MSQIRLFKGIDWLIIVLVLAIFAFGVLNIYSVDQAKGKKELVLFGVAFALIFGSIIVNAIIKNFFQTYSWLFYFIGLISLVGVLIVGKEINGAKAWYSFGGFTIQPAEFVKVATALFLGFMIESKQLSLKSPQSIGIVLLILALPTVLILLQPDVGSILVYFAFIIALSREGLHWSFVVVPIIGIIVFLICVTGSPLYFLIFFGSICLILIVLFSFFVQTQSKQIIHFFRGCFLALFLYFSIIFLFVITNRFNGLIPYEVVQYKFMYGINATRTIIGFYVFIAMAISLTYFFMIHRKEGLELSPFQVKESSRRFIMQAFLPVSFLLLLIIGIGLSSKIIFNEFLPKHQKERVMVLFEGEKKYRDTSGYNLLYSKTAIGSGELKGKGYMEGTVKKGRFVPEQSTDYIFCTVGEEWGFIGSSILLFLYMLLILRIFWVAESHTKVFTRFFGYSVGSIILLHFIINIGMVTGLFPTVGIPLPFFSYGGSSLWAFSLFIGIFLILNYEGKQSLF